MGVFEIIVRKSFLPDTLYASAFTPSTVDASDEVVVVVAAVVVVVAAAVVVGFGVVETLGDAFAVVTLCVVVGFAVDVSFVEGDSFLASNCVTLGDCVVVEGPWLSELLLIVVFVVVEVAVLAFCFFPVPSQGHALVLCREPTPPGRNSTSSDLALGALDSVGERDVFELETVVVEAFVPLVDLD